MADNRTITVKVKLTVDEFVDFEGKCAEVGFSQSSIGRWLIRQWLKGSHSFNLDQGLMFNKDHGPVRASKTND